MYIPGRSRYHYYLMRISPHRRYYITGALCTTLCALWFFTYYPRYQQLCTLKKETTEFKQDTLSPETVILLKDEVTVEAMHVPHSSDILNRILDAAKHANITVLTSSCSNITCECTLQAPWSQLYTFFTQLAQNISHYYIYSCTLSRVSDIVIACSLHYASREHNEPSHTQSTQPTTPVSPLHQPLSSSFPKKPF